MFASLILTAAIMLSTTLATPIQSRQTSISIYTLHDLTRVCSNSPYGASCNYNLTLIESNNTGTFYIPCYYGVGTADIRGDEYTDTPCDLYLTNGNSSKLLFSQSYFASSPISYYGLKVVDTGDSITSQVVRAADFIFEAPEYEGNATDSSIGTGSKAIVEPDHTATAYNTFYQATATAAAARKA